jgi:hypothetical protein
MAASDLTTTRGWLQRYGAREVGRFDADLLFEIR